MFEIEKYLQEAIQIAVEAGAKIEEAQKLVKQIETKENTADLVTKTDKAVEDFIFSRLSVLFPDHVMIGEESSSSKINQFSKSPTWIVDPIDGTTNFVHGFPFYCVSIGMALEGKPTIGVIYNPVLGQLFYASAGHGAYLKQGNPDQIMGNSAPIKLGSKCAELPLSLSQALLSTEYGAAKTDEYLLPKLDIIKSFISDPVSGRGIRSLGSAALSMCLIAQGVVDIYYEAGVHAWDVAAGAVIVKEAGGILRGWNQEEFDLLDRTVLCVRPSPSNDQNPPLLKELISILKPIAYPRD